ncbi:hypothetical protein [Janibacter anophelis]|uniref:hypothetical protein n=1 Tax=Janibacter anophelis TaxID=319054 RepID=UPI0013B056F5|nr:hypothetical protein [Janibacter anophelis]
MTTRRQQAESVTSVRSFASCPQCGAPVVRSHRCPATPRTSILHGPPVDWRDQVEAERRSARLDDDEAWEEQLLPLEPVDEPPPSSPGP